jgi:hypothetical protein
MTVSRRTIVVAGLPVHVFSETDLGEIKGHVMVTFFLHGRLETAHEYEERAETIVKLVSEKGKSKRPLVLVTFVRHYRFIATV